MRWLWHEISRMGSKSRFSTSGLAFWELTKRHVLPWSTHKIHFYCKVRQSLHRSRIWASFGLGGVGVAWKGCVELQRHFWACELASVFLRGVFDRIRSAVWRASFTYSNWIGANLSSFWQCDAVARMCFDSQEAQILRQGCRLLSETTSFERPHGPSIRSIGHLSQLKKVASCSYYCYFGAKDRRHYPHYPYYTT